MGDDQFTFVPEVTTAGIEKVLVEEERCTKGVCTDRICIWKTPGGHGFTAPNPRTVAKVPATVLGDLKRKIRLLDGRAFD